jgi:DNA-binding response OmpR family regulator
MNKKNTVLIVEDETDLRGLLKKKLTDENFEVFEAENGKTGLEVSLSKHPDIILLDVIMPVMDGLSMLEELRKNEWGKSAKVIVLSNLNEAEKVSESLEKNIYNYLIKANWEPDDIVKLIKKSLGLITE